MDTISINNRRYLGSKYKLLNFIQETINKECKEYDSFLDLFGGTGIVGYNFNNEKTKIIINDLLESNYISYLSWFGNDEINEEMLYEIMKEYNKIDVKKDNYFSRNFANTYFSKLNTKKIGFIREDIEKKYKNKEINLREKAILITSLLYAMDKIANTVGHYDAYRKKGDLTRELKMKMLDIPNLDINKDNMIYNKDANKLVKEVSADLVYIDPPYNSRQYSDAYHLLENVATWKKPKVLGVAKKMDRTHIKSKYCTVSATKAFDELILNIKAKYIIISYNNMGNKGAGRSQAKISDEDILNSLQKVGRVTTHEIEYNQFTTGSTKIDEHKERLFVCHVGEKPKKALSKDKKKNNDYAKSPLNYTGGKFKLLEQIIPKFPKNIDKFLDLFAGGGNVGVNVECNKVLCNDKQEEVVKLLDLFNKYQDNYIIEKIENIIYNFHLSNTFENGYKFYNCESSGGVGKYNKEGFMNLRSEYNKILDCEEKDFYLLTLIIFSFNNQIRFNNKGEYNLPTGKRDFNKSIRKNIKNFVSKMKEKEISFNSEDFRCVISKEADESTFVYCDPPYYLGNASYNENGGWSEKDELDLLNHLEMISKKGIKFALSNVIEHKGNKHQILIDWCIRNEFNINYLKYNYKNSNYQIKDKESKTSEVLITNY